MEKEKKEKNTSDIKVLVNGKDIGLNPFVSQVISNVVVGIVKSLKGVGAIEDIEIKVKK